MVGGVPDRFDDAKEILSKMGKNVVHCGASGTGQVVSRIFLYNLLPELLREFVFVFVNVKAAKICNNMLLGISMIGTAEAMNLGMK